MKLFFNLNYLLFLNSFLFLSSQCSYNCNLNGICNIYSRCLCYNGYQGSNCSIKICPKGISSYITTITNYYDNNNNENNQENLKHNLISCSGNGICNEITGICNCYNNYYGISCEKSKCNNNCNGHGVCLSLSDISNLYDGYNFNHTTSYSLWDKDINYGCQCDVGYTGYDCSEKICESGPDPRSSSSLYEKVTLICTTTSNSYSGKFKFRFYGKIMKLMLNVSSTSADLQRELMKMYSDYSNTYPSLYTPIIVSSNSASGTLCSGSTTVTTTIKYYKKGNIPALSIYYQKLYSTSLYFQTTQYLGCNCTNSKCGGSFRLAYEGEITPKINIFEKGSKIYTYLSQMKTLAGQTIEIQNQTIDSYVGSTDSSVKICQLGVNRNHSIVLKGPIGNLPQFTLIPDGVEDSTLDIYTAPDNTTDVTNRILTLFSFDGRDEGVKLCNGLGNCNSNTGKCECSYGWELDPVTGQCSQPTYNSSDWGGINRCPGLISRLKHEDWSTVRNQEKLYVSVNPFRGHWSAAILRSMIYVFDLSETYNIPDMKFWQPKDKYPRVIPSTKKILLNMTTALSAGPLIIDRVKNTLIYVDNNAASPFIGKLILTTNTTASSHSSWLSVTGQIFGFALDAHFRRRKLYWTIPGTGFGKNGDLYWEYIDSSSPTGNRLTLTIGQKYLIEPMGLAIHYKQSKLYWIDIDTSLGHQTTVLRRCDLDGSNVNQAFLYKNIPNVPIQANATDIVINLRNNTLYYISNADPQGIIVTNLDKLNFLSMTESPYNRDYYNVSVIHSTEWMDLSSPNYLFMDDTRDVLLWTDETAGKINWMDMKKNYLRNTSSGVIFDFTLPEHLKIYSMAPFNYQEQFDVPYGIAIDKGMHNPEWGQYLECYGHGRCLGLSGNWECECYDGYFGDCSQRTCPKGNAWFSEPYVDNISHDIEVECSNKGTCNRKTGECECELGYEGSACQRSTCYSTDTPCNGNGRCLSMSAISLKHTNSSGDSEPLIYGSKHHDPTTWDAHMRYGCYADNPGYVYTPSSSPSSPTLSTYHYISPYISSNLSLLSCPYGYDIRATDYNTVHEIQSISCSASTGTFQLEFNGFKSDLISHNSTLQDLKEILERIGSIGEITVYSSSGNNTNICSTTSTPIVVNILFLTELGDLPMIKIVQNRYNTLKLNGLTSSIIFKVIELRKGSGLLLECSGHGDCDRSNGLCKCWSNWGSSDGRGNMGTRGDCGYNVIV